MVVGLARSGIALAAAAALSGCASIMTGTTQRIAVDSSPSGAQCNLSRANQPLGAVVTPGQIEVSKSAYSIQVDCDRNGVRGQTLVASHLQAATFGNALVGGAVGAGVDFYTGAAHSYPDSVMVPLGSNASQPAPAESRPRPSRRESGEPVS